MIRQVELWKAEYNLPTGTTKTTNFSHGDPSTFTAADEEPLPSPEELRKLYAVSSVSAISPNFILPDPEPVPVAASGAIVPAATARAADVPIREEFECSDDDSALRELDLDSGLLGKIGDGLAGGKTSGKTKEDYADKSEAGMDNDVIGDDV